MIKTSLVIEKKICFVDFIFLLEVALLKKMIYFPCFEHIFTLIRYNFFKCKEIFLYFLLVEWKVLEKHWFNEIIFEFYETDFIKYEIKVIIKRAFHNVKFSLNLQSSLFFILFIMFHSQLMSFCFFYWKMQK